MRPLPIFRFAFLTRRSFCGSANRDESGGPIAAQLLDGPGCRQLLTPPAALVESLTHKQRNKMALLLAELEVLSRLENSRLPGQLKDRDWRYLTVLNSADRRYEHLMFLAKREAMRARKSAQIAAYKEDKATWEKRDDGMFKHRLLPQINTVLSERLLGSLRLFRSVQLAETPRVAVDCRFLPLLTALGLNRTIVQMRYLIANNRQRAEPWPLFFTNFAEENALLSEERTRYLKPLDGEKVYAGELTSRSYLDLFPTLAAKQKIIYLSPDAVEPIETIEADACYVVCAVVDVAAERCLPLQTSFVTAEREGIPCRRLPVDSKIFRDGNTRFTLSRTLKVLQDVFDSNGDWETALTDYFPKSKLLTDPRVDAEQKRQISAEPARRERNHARHLGQIVREQTAQFRSNLEQKRK